MRRFGDPDEVAALAVMLALDEAAYMTGAELNIDGGLLVGSAAAPKTDCYVATLDPDRKSSPERPRRSSGHLGESPRWTGRSPCLKTASILSQSRGYAS
ncbi:SDR family oxidoreductase [Roseovarius ramblicola]|uniref:SDR family oxidoreductase n=1 Tax=Roseovarius ramblicola TaxID=2022336 RepID=A0ABV5HXQ8_9RHOB